MREWRRKATNIMQSGGIMTVLQLSMLFENNELLQMTESVRRDMLAAWERWLPSHLLAETHRTIQLYMGLSSGPSIVSFKLHPRSCK